MAETPAAWFATAERHEGSWWTDWGKWVRGHSGDETAARQPGDGELPAIEDAPGSYVSLQ